MPEILQAAFARHGQTVVTAHRKDIQYGAVALWELQDEGGKLRPVTAPQAILQEGHTFPISSAVVSRRGDATEILTIGVDANVCFWDAQQRRQVLRLSGVSRQLSFGSPLVATSADGRFVLAAGSGGFLAKIWDRQKLNPAAGHPPLQVLEGHFGFVTSVAISRSGKYLLTGDQAGRAIFWKQDPATGQYASGWSVPPAGFKISSVAFLPDESRAILAASYQIRQFDVASGKELEARRLNASDDIASLAMSRDGARLLTGCTNGTLTLWDLNQPDAKAARLATLAARNRQIKAVALAAGGKVALDVGSPANDVRLLSLGAGDTLQEVATLNLPGQAADSAAFVTDDGAQIVVAGGVQARLWNVSRTPPQLLHEFRPDAVATSAQVSADGASVLSCHEDGVVKIWDSASGLVRARLTGQPTVGVRFAAFHPDGKELVTAALDGSVAIWNAAGGEFLRLLCRHASGKPLRHAAFSRDGSLLVTASDDRTAQIWDAVSGAPQHILEGHSGAVLCAAFSPDGRWLVTGGEDPEARMWSVETGQTVALLQGHGKQVATVGFSPDGRRVATGSADETAKIWAIRFQADARQQTIGIESVDEVLTLRSHRGEVTSAEFSPDGRNLLTGSRDGRAIVWPSAPGP
jgi:hypothetical protein